MHPPSRWYDNPKTKLFNFKFNAPSCKFFPQFLNKPLPHPQNPPYLSSKIQKNVNHQTTTIEQSRLSQSIELQRGASSKNRRRRRPGRANWSNCSTSWRLTTMVSRGGRRVPRVPRRSRPETLRTWLSRSHNRYATRIWPHSIKGDSRRSLELNGFRLLHRGSKDVTKRV